MLNAPVVLRPDRLRQREAGAGERGEPHAAGAGRAVGPAAWPSQELPAVVGRGMQGHTPEQAGDLEQEPVHETTPELTMSGAESVQ